MPSDSDFESGLKDFMNVKLQEKKPYLPGTEVDYNTLTLDELEEGNMTGPVISDIQTNIVGMKEAAKADANGVTDLKLHEMGSKVVRHSIALEGLRELRSRMHPGMMVVTSYLRQLNCAEERAAYLSKKLEQK